MTPVISFHNQLVSSGNQLQIIGMVKLLWYILWKQYTHNQQKLMITCKINTRFIHGELITWPKVYPAPLGEIPQPQRSSGSDHRRSHMGPSWGTSCTRSKLRMLSRVSMDGDNPPWRQNISDSTCKSEEYVTSETLFIENPGNSVLYELHRDV